MCLCIVDVLVVRTFSSCHAALNGHLNISGSSFPARHRVANHVQCNEFRAVQQDVRSNRKFLFEVHFPVCQMASPDLGGDGRANEI